MKRKLTEDERRLWAGVTRAVRPLQLPREARAAGRFAEASAPPQPETLSAPPMLAAQRPRIAGLATPALTRLPRRDKQRLARGRSAIDARIDLHGMTQAEAHAALSRFLRRAQTEEATFVLVITGTGARGGTSERGVLRRQVPLWLQLPEFRAYVLGFEPAHVGHGGAGALYVRLRRASRLG